MASREEALAAVIQELERRFGPGIVYRLSQATPKVGETAISTGSLGLDVATGVGGVPRGRITEILGPDSSGKTSLAYHILANAQRDHGLAVLVDAEGSADSETMQKLDVDLSDLVLATPASTEEALEMVDILVRSQSLDALVFSTVPALYTLPPLPAASLPSPPPAEAEPTPGDRERAARRRSALLSEALRKVNASLKGSPTAVVFLNQGTAAGGYALAFYASLRIDLAPLRPLLRPWGDAVGVGVRARVIKNRLAQPLICSEFDLLEGRGVHRESELVEWGLRRGVVERSSLGLAYAGQVLGLGLLRAAARLEQDPDLAERLEQALRH